MLPFHPMVGAKGGINTADPGHVLFTTPGTYFWTVPDGVYEMSAVTIGGGQKGLASSFTTGGYGADLRWINGLAVIPGETLTIIVAAAGNSPNDKNFVSEIRRGAVSLLCADGTDGRTSTSFGASPDGRTVVGGGNGGPRGGSFAFPYGVGGGGAGGYSGNGGSGASYDGNGTLFPGSSGSGGSGAGGTQSQSGGGVGLYGEGPSGIYGQNDNGGSIRGDGRRFGGGGGATGSTPLEPEPGGVRVLWGKGPNNGGRALPATNVFTATA